MNKLILVRPGRTAWDEEDIDTLDDCRLQGTLPLPLSASGQKALEQIVESLRREQLECLYSSGNESSGPTAKHLAKLCRLKARKVAALRELDCGSWQGLRFGEIKKRFPRAYRQWRNDPAKAAAPQGESMQEAFDRVAAGLDSILDKAQDETVVVVAAPIVCGLIECYLMEKSLDELWQIIELQTDTRIFNKVQGRWMAPPAPQPSDTNADSSDSVVERTITVL